MSETPTAPETTTPTNAHERVIDRVRRAFLLKSWDIAVPEWPDPNGNPTVLCFTPLTVDDAERTKMDEHEKLSYHVRGLRLLIQKARLKNGQRAFEDGDFEYLRSEANLLVVQRVLSFMWEAGTLTTDEARQVLVDTPPSAATSTSPQS